MFETLAVLELLKADRTKTLSGMYFLRLALSHRCTSFTGMRIKETRSRGGFKDTSIVWSLELAYFPLCVSLFLSLVSSLCLHLSLLGVLSCYPFFS